MGDTGGHEPNSIAPSSLVLPHRRTPQVTDRNERRRSNNPQRAIGTEIGSRLLLLHQVVRIKSKIQATTSAPTATTAYSKRRNWASSFSAFPWIHPAMYSVR
jgi:hypothetical protein